MVQIIFNNESLNFVGIEQQRPVCCSLAWISRIRILRRWPRPWARKGFAWRNLAMGRTRIAEALAYKDGPVVVDGSGSPCASSLPSHVLFLYREGLYAEHGQERWVVWTK